MNALAPIGKRDVKVLEAAAELTDELAGEIDQLRARVTRLGRDGLPVAVLPPKQLVRLQRAVDSLLLDISSARGDLREIVVAIGTPGGVT